MGFFDNVVQKLNPAQQYISNGGKVQESSIEPSYAYTQCYKELEIVNRGVNMLVDDVSAIKHAVGDQLPTIGSVSGARKVSLDRLLNREPNPYQDQDSFLYLLRWYSYVSPSSS
jgi:hypothetical protein